MDTPHGAQSLPLLFHKKPSHLYSLATAIRNSNRELSIASVSTYVRCLVAQSCFRFLDVLDHRISYVNTFMVRSAFVVHYVRTYIAEHALFAHMNLCLPILA